MMKGPILIFSILLFSFSVFSQNITFSDDDGYTPHPSAILDVYSTSSGILVPRMTSAQRIVISSPADGLLVYDTNFNGFFFYSGSGWVQITSGEYWAKSGNQVYLADNGNDVGIGLTTPGTKLIVQADASNGIDESIFAVLNNDGDTIFAVYPEGVRIWVNDDGGSKANGSRGGFAVGGFSPAKAGFTNEYLRVTPDSVRIYIDDEYTASKLTGSRGGFAVGGFSPAKGSLTNHYLFVQDDSTRVYIADTLEGFGVENIEASENARIMKLNKENYLIGHKSGINLTNGAFNSFFGYETGISSQDASENVFIGYRAGYHNISGDQNNFIGCYAGYSNTTGSFNIVNGPYAAYSNTTGNYNTANGFQALYSNTIGSNNTANGYQAMYSNISGGVNTAYGYYSMYTNSSGYENTAVGYRSLYFNTTGFRNTAIGYQALYSNTTGSYNTALGYYAFLNGAGYENSTAVGYNTDITGSNQVRFGNTAVTSIGGFVDWTDYSDARFKKDISENVPGLDFIKKLRPVTYHLDMDGIAEYLHTPDSLRLKDAEQVKGRMLQTGFIAQEVEAAANDLGYDFSGVDRPQNKDGFYGLRYGGFTVPLVKAIQEQQIIIDDQNEKIKALEEKVDFLIKELEKQKENK